MPPHLHPRSTATSTLFAGTLLASFVVVGIPHVFPCPRPQRGYADSERQIQYDAEGKPVGVRQRTKAISAENGKLSTTNDQRSVVGGSQMVKSLQNTKTLQEEAALFQEFKREAEMVDREARECPVPKPGGFIGKLMGFHETKTDKSKVMDVSAKG